MNSKTYDLPVATLTVSSRKIKYPIHVDFTGASTLQYGKDFTFAANGDVIINDGETSPMLRVIAHMLLVQGRYEHFYCDQSIMTLLGGLFSATKIFSTRVTVHSIAYDTMFTSFNQLVSRPILKITYKVVSADSTRYPEITYALNDGNDQLIVDAFTRSLTQLPLAASKLLVLERATVDQLAGDWLLLFAKGNKDVMKYKCGNVLESFCVVFVIYSEEWKNHLTRIQRPTIFAHNQNHSEYAVHKKTVPHMYTLREKPMPKKDPIMERLLAGVSASQPPHLTLPSAPPLTLADMDKLLIV